VNHPFVEPIDRLELTGQVREARARLEKLKQQ